MSKGKTLNDNGFMRFLVTFQKAILIITNGSCALIVAVGVFMRYVLHKDFFGQEEIITVIAMWLYWIGGVYSSYRDDHISADVVSTMVKNYTVKKILRIFVLIVSLVILVIFSKWSVDYVTWAIGEWAKSMGLKIPLIYGQGALCVGFFGMTFYTLIQLILELTGHGKVVREPKEPVQEGGAA